MLNAALLTLAVLVAPAGKAKPATNTVCPTCPMKVNEKSPVATVRGQDYRTCCKTCSADLEKNPDKFLNKDGTPKNAKKN